MTIKSQENIQIKRIETTSLHKSEEKELYEYFEDQTGEKSQKNIWTWLRKENLKRKTESLLIAAKKKTTTTTMPLGPATFK